MYELFTPRARKVLQLANQEAQRLNHESIASEHILLGLVKEGTGVAAQLFMNLKVDLQKIRLAVVMVVPKGPQAISPGKLPQAPETLQVIQYAIDEAAKLQHSFVGTEHLLLALLREQEGIVAQVFKNLDLNRQHVYRQLLDLIGGPPPVRPEPLPTEMIGIKGFGDVVCATVLAVFGGAVGGEVASRLYPTLHNLVFWPMAAVYVLVNTILVFPLKLRRRPLAMAMMWLSSGFLIGTFAMWSPDGVNAAMAGALSAGLSILALATAIWAPIGERRTLLVTCGLAGAVLGFLVGFSVGGATALAIGVSLDYSSILPPTGLALAGLLGACAGAYIASRLANRIPVPRP